MANTVYSRQKSLNTKTTKYYPEFEHHSESKAHMDPNSHQNKLNAYVKIFNKGDQPMINKKPSTEKKSPIYIHSIKPNNFNNNSNFSISNPTFIKHNSVNAPQLKPEPPNSVGLPDKAKRNILQHLEEQYWANWKPPVSDKKPIKTCTPKLVKNRLAILKLKAEEQNQSNLKNFLVNTGKVSNSEKSSFEKFINKDTIDNDSIYSNIYKNNSFDQNISLKKVGNRLVENYFKQGMFKTVNDEINFRMKHHATQLNESNKSFPISQHASKESQEKDTKAAIEQLNISSTASLAGDLMTLSNADNAAQTDFHVEIEYPDKPEKDTGFTPSQILSINDAFEETKQEENLDVLPELERELIANHAASQDKNLNDEETKLGGSDPFSNTSSPSITNIESKEIVSIYTDQVSDFNIDIERKLSIETKEFISTTDSDVNVLRHTDSFILTKKKQSEQHSQFQQPKCIRLYKKDNLLTTNFSYKGGSYPLRPILKKEPSTTSKSSVYLGKPGKSMFVASSIYSKFLKRK